MGIEDITYFLDNLGDAILFADESSNIIFANQACADLFGYKQDKMKELKLDDLMDKSLAIRKSHKELVKNYIHSNEKAKVMMARTDMPCINSKGELFYSRISIAHVELAGKIYGIATLQNYTQIRNTMANLKVKSNIDSLTGLYNRHYLNELLNSNNSPVSSWQTYGVLFLDLDKFKPINDTLGHNIGDAILKAVSLRIQDLSRNTDLLFRLGGDEFLLLFNLSDSLNKKKSLIQISQNLVASLKQPFKIQEHKITLDVSIGAGIIPDNADNLADLINLTDKAMYHSKNHNQSVTFIEK